MTQVTAQARASWPLAVLFLASTISWAQRQSPASNAAESQSKQSSIPAPRPAEGLYLKLHSVGLDPARTYRIRGASLDRPALHVSLGDGEISFTSDVAGRVTGAFFEGDGELLLTPPNRVERASMALFTGMAILEERFGSAYLRFNDETLAELQPYFRPAEDAQEFSARWNNTAQNLAELDALRLLGSFSRGLPATGGMRATMKEPSAISAADDRMLHIRAQGHQLGTFDVYFDTKGQEELWAGQVRTVEGLTFYDLWTSFTPFQPNRAVVGNRPSSTHDDVDISRYKIRVDVEPPTTLTAEALLEVEVRRSGERTLFFELSRFLKVGEVDVDDHPVEFINNTAIDGTQLARRGNDLVGVVFPEALHEGQKHELKFRYKGDVLSEAGGGLLYVGARGTWYPNRGRQMANFDLEFLYPADWTLVATGKRVAQSTDSTAVWPPGDGGKQTGRWITERPSVLAGFNLGRYERASTRAGDVIVEAYAAHSMEKAFPHPAATVISPPTPLPPPSGMEPIVRQSMVPSPARNAQAVADYGARAVEFLSRRFGPYPYSSLELTQMPGPVSQGWPGLVFLSSYTFLTPTETEDLTSNSLQVALNRLVLPHETAHQWWGDLVGWQTYRDQWIVEALANYCALMMMEVDKPSDARKVLESYRADLLQKNKGGESLLDAGPVTLGLRLNSSHFPNGYEAVSYGRGTWLFHMLRHMLLDAETTQAGGSSKISPDREEPFIRALRKVRERYAGEAISARELFAVFEEDLPKSLWYEGRKSLDWFVQGWVEGVALPHFSIQNLKFVRKAGGTEVTGTIQQKESPSDLVSAVPVFAVSAGKPVLLGTVLADGPETAFRFVVPAGTRKIVLDAYQTLLTSPK